MTALTAAVLTQGVGFLYGQAGELLRRRRERAQQADAPSTAGSPVQIPPAGEAEQVLVGELIPGPVDERALEDHAERLARLRGLLGPYAQGDLEATPGDGQLREQVEALRSLLEQIYRQHITFHGERRPVTGTPLGVQTGDVGRYATQVIASGERAVAVGRDLTGTVNTGDRNSLNRPPLE